MIPRESDFTTKQEISSTTSITTDGAKISTEPSSTNPTSSWSRLKDPRVVRVSRAFGGKDRHSKVCTVRGLRDRRVRLSVPTAIQLYDLQERLGLNQPSKVVDWLLNVAKHEIDELPPLQIPQGCLISQNLLITTSDELGVVEKQGLKINDHSMMNWNNEPLKEESTKLDGTINWGKISNEDREENWGDQGAAAAAAAAYLSANNNFLSRQNPTNSLLNSSTIPLYNSFLTNLTLSQPPRSNELSSTNEDLHNFSLSVPMQSNMSASQHHHQVLVYQPGTSTQSYFPFQIPVATSSEIDHKQVHFQSLTSPVDSSSAAQPVRPFHFHMAENHQNNGAGGRGKQRQ